jgi:4-hydroxybenzoate polyprenyltransferase
MSRLRTYAQLVRLPNLPSALADIGLGALVVGGGRVPEHWGVCLLLAPASACLYCAGMVWNDYFDVAQDRRERPERPIPSGRVTRREAGQLAGLLCGAGLLFAALAGLLLKSMLPGVLALLLVGAILAYDGVLKRTPLGPAAMGLCRFLNVLLGVSCAGSLLWPKGAHLALVVGLYIGGLTWFARTEARTSRQWELVGAMLLMFCALALALLLPMPMKELPQFKEVNSSVLFPYLLVAVGFAVGLPASQAVASPSPMRVQSAVKRALMALVPLDATLASALAGSWGLLLLVLMAPSLYLNRRRWLYAT